VRGSRRKARKESWIECRAMKTDLAISNSLDPGGQDENTRAVTLHVSDYTGEHKSPPNLSPDS
jgi:hypothetical protein